MVPVQTPHPRSRCLLPSACGGSFPWQVLMSPPSTRAQSPLMVLGAAFRGQHGCLEAEMGHSETGTWGAPAVPQTLPCWDAASKATDVEEARSHSATAQAAFGDLTSPKAPAFRGATQPVNPGIQIYTETAETQGPRRPRAPGASCSGPPGRFRSLSFHSQPLGVPQNPSGHPDLASLLPASCHEARQGCRQPAPGQTGDARRRSAPLPAAPSAPRSAVQDPRHPSFIPLHPDFMPLHPGFIL